MMFFICLIATLGTSLALPSPPLAWEDIKGENVYIEPIGNYTVDVPVDGRVIGGSEVARNSVPYQVAVFIDGRSFCGGSLISRNYVLSAAHCTISASFVELVFGAHSANAEEPTQVRVTSSNIINHPGYVSSTLRNDVSLIKTPSPLVLNNYVQLITLAPSDAGTFTGSRGRLTGWGRISDASTGIASTLQEVELNTISNALCSTYYAIIVDSTICTSGEGTVGACFGDSGGPLIVDGIQVGVTSFVSARGCEAGLPSGFARVSYFKKWIDQNSDVSL